MNEILDFTPIERANVPAAHFARLCGATRVSAFKWLRGTNPRGLYFIKAKQGLAMVNKALAAGTLPLPPTVKRKDQYKAFTAALRAATKN